MRECKTIAMYLPQFHRVKENDEWWGEGFTEWTTVKRAKPFFDGHIQPRHPLEGKYYDLTQKSSMLWQAQLMNKYGIYGACFYHYYFADGRKILEKPAENLLQWKEIPMNYCFCWAMASWTRTWSAVSGNSWSDIYEKKEDSNSDGVLLKQEFGLEREWRKHFYYLLPFFRDDRYIKINDRPVFCFFTKSSYIESMVACWRNLSRIENIQPPYIIVFNSTECTPGVDATVLHAPHMVWDLSMTSHENGITRTSFDYTWDKIMAFETNDHNHVFLEGVGNWDDTPRRGDISGVISDGYSLTKLEEYMEELYIKSMAWGNEFVFYNAWNEWGEGMYLEPDEEEGYGRLEALKRAQERAKARIENDGEKELTHYKNMMKQIETTPEHEKTKTALTQARSRANNLNLLLEICENEIDIGVFLKKHGFHTISIYGFGQVGKHFARMLESQGVNISYFIDRKISDSQNSKYHVYKIEDSLPFVDVIVITPVFDYSSIYESLSQKISGDCVILPIDILLERMIKDE